MRILIVSEPGIDGVFRHVDGLINFLLKVDALEVHFAYSSRRSSARLQDLVAQVESAGGRAIDLNTGNAPSLTDIKAYRNLLRFARQLAPDVIHSHSSKAGALARLLPRSASSQILYTPNAYYGMGQSGGVKTFLFNAIERVLGARGINIHVSPEEAQFAHQSLYLDSNKSVPIPNAVDFSIFREVVSPDERAEIRQALGLPQDALVIGSIGRLSYQKNPEALYRAFARLTQQLTSKDPLLLLHVGDGSPQELKAMAQLADELGIADQVIRPAYRSDPEIFYRAMDAFCLSSRYEGLPFTGLEALASRLPLILNDAPGLRSFGATKYGFNHVYYGETENPDSLAEAMLRWYQQRAKPINHRAVAEQHFSIPQVYGQILDLYRSVAHKL